MNKKSLGGWIVFISIIAASMYFWIVFKSGKTLFSIPLLNTKNVSKVFEFKINMNPLRIKLEAESLHFYPHTAYIDVSIENMKNETIYKYTFKVKRRLFKITRLLGLERKRRQGLNETFYSSIFKIPESGSYKMTITVRGETDYLDKLKLELKYNVASIDFKIILVIAIAIIIGFYLRYSYE